MVAHLSGKTAMNKLFNNTLKTTQLLTLILSIVTLLSFVSCEKKEPIKIGFVGGLTGRVADLGIAGRDGTILAVEKVNKAGGINGRPVKLLIKDDKQDAETARRVVTELIEAEVVAIIGHMTSSMSTATVPLVNQNKVVMMSPTTTTKYLKGKDDYFFRVISTTDSYASKMATHLKNNLGLTSITALYDLRNKAYTESWLEDFRITFEGLGGEVSYVEAFQSGPDVHFYELARRAIDSGAPAILTIAGAMDTAMLSQQIRKLDKDIPIVAPEWASTEKLIDLGGVMIDGIIVSQFFDRFSDDSVYVAFRDDYIARFGEHPGFASVGAYDAVNTVLEALRKKEKKQTLKEAILRISEFQGAQGRVSIDHYGDAERKTFITTVENGQFRVVE
jgi:branched-chain amino acid transport system substrate-binding protein